MAKTKQKSKGSKFSRASRPPVVTIMGHVDHGKTTLLDYIRKAKVVESEYGGITQHIGAYQVAHKGKLITFIDTPGHAAFAKMRARGASVTDIVVLVVAANDGVKPQTVESINHIKAAKVALVVAINKMDLPEADANLVKSQLVKYGVQVEGYGGQTPVVEISAKTGKNVDQLLEVIQLVAEMEELKADLQGRLKAVVIESHLNTKKGSMATLLVQSGTLKVGQTIFTTDQEVRVRAMTDAMGRQVKEAFPSTPVAVLGFKSPPLVGSTVTTSQEVAEVVPELPSVKIKPELIEDEEKSEKEVKDVAKLSLEELDQLTQTKAEKRPHIRVVLKADATGTLEAIEGSFSEEVEVVGKGVGEISESDVMLANGTKATVVGFNVGVSKQAEQLAKNEKVTIKTYKVIYELLEDLEKQVLKLMEPTIDEEELGMAEITAIFEIKGERIAGCKVKSGEIGKNSLIHIKRDEEIIADTKIKSLRRNKEDIEAAKAKSECGIVFTDKIDFKEGDAIIAYKKIND